MLCHAGSAIDHLWAILFEILDQTPGPQTAVIRFCCHTRWQCAWGLSMTTGLVVHWDWLSPSSMYRPPVRQRMHSQVHTCKRTGTALSQSSQERTFWFYRELYDVVFRNLLSWQQVLFVSKNPFEVNMSSQSHAHHLQSIKPNFTAQTCESCTYLAHHELESIELLLLLFFLLLLLW